MKRFQLRPPRPAKLAENDVEQQCLDMLRYRGYYPVRLQVGLFKTADGRWVTMGEKGLPDYIAIHQHHPGFFLEVKRPGATTSTVQLQKHYELAKFYRLAVAVVDNHQALTEWLKSHERSDHASPNPHHIPAPPPG